MFFYTYSIKNVISPNFLSVREMGVLYSCVSLYYNLLTKRIFCDGVGKTAREKSVQRCLPQGLNQHGGRDRIKSKVPSESGAEVRNCKESGEKQYFSTPFWIGFPPYFIIPSSLQLWAASPWSPSSFTQWSVKLLWIRSLKTSETKLEHAVFFSLTLSLLQY